MKLCTHIVICLFLIACRPSQTTQSITDSRTIKKEQKADIDSLFIVYSVPIYVSYTDNFTRPEIADSLIALLKRRKYKCIDSSAYVQLYREKIMELMPTNSIEGMREMQAKLQYDKNYYTNKFQSADPFAQQIQLSFSKTDSGMNYINVRRSNAPNPKKFRNWSFTYSDLEPSNQFAARILDSLINTNRINEK
jgi:hypothetical protein